jgi:hypothetical protein
MYWTIEDRDEFALFGCKEEQHIAQHVQSHPELLEGNEYIVCKYERLDSVVPLEVKSLKTYIHELRSRTV